MHGFFFFDRAESFSKTIEGQVRCITAEFKQTGVNVAWHISYINVLIPAWMVPPMDVSQPPPRGNQKSTLKSSNGSEIYTANTVRR